MMCCAWVMLRQHHLERRALSRARAFNGDLPTMQIDDTLDDRKAEAGRGFACSRLRREPLETAEQSRNVLRRQARPWSLTCTSIPPCSCATKRSMAPPFGLYLTALLTRLSIASRMRSASQMAA